MFLFLATLILTAGSLGTVSNGGGDDGDGGSGIGGTGKSGEFGGSGFGGTGGPSPFFTSIDDNTQSEDATANENNEAISLKTEIAQSLEPSVLLEETRRVLEIAPVAPAIVAVPKTTTPIQLAEASAPAELPQPRVEVVASEQVMPEIAEYNPVPDNDISTTPPIALEPQPVVVVSAAVEPAALPDETMTVAHESEDEKVGTSVDRNSIPDRIQRPELPPFQRIRPVERPSLLPSRVQPMRI